MSRLWKIFSPGIGKSPSFRFDRGRPLGGNLGQDGRIVSRLFEILLAGFDRGRARRRRAAQEALSREARSRGAARGVRRPPVSALMNSAGARSERRQLSGRARRLAGAGCQSLRAQSDRYFPRESGSLLIERLDAHGCAASGLELAESKIDLHEKKYSRSLANGLYRLPRGFRLPSSCGSTVLARAGARPPPLGGLVIFR